ncbi:MAG: hypothetical protein JWP97_6766 [Labilithrix sp.]|nr:hypothetical protein [Labilithrix sp.]
MMALHSRVRSSVRSALAVGVSVFVLGGLGALGSAACSSSSDDPANGGEGGTNGEPLFRVVQHDLLVRCGGANGSCHVKGTVAPHWLGDPDAYVSAKNYPGILPATRDPNDSIILTQVAHTGPALKGFPELYDHTAAWINAEMPGPPLPTTGAFAVLEGPNVQYLDPLGEGYAGGKISFLGSNGTNGTLSLTALTVTAPQNANLTLDSPFFVKLPRSGKVKADPVVNGFQGELTVPAGTTVDLYTGSMVLTGWDPAGQLKIVFKAITSAPGQGKNTQCTALDVWNTKAVPAMQTMLDITGDDQNDGGTFDGGVIGKGSCLGCHAQDVDGSLPPPVLAMDLRAYVTDPATACGHARTMINFQDKAKSLIILNPTGQANPNHPIKKLDPSDPIIQGIKAWVDAEKE